MVARQKKEAGEKVWAIPYDYIGACGGASGVCLGVPYFNWGPGYVSLIKDCMSGNWKSEWIWLGPDWKDINDPDTSTVGFARGGALSSSTGKALTAFTRDLGTGKVNLFKGPLSYQDGSTYLKTGQVATDEQIWYMKQLLKGMTGQGSAK